MVCFEISVDIVTGYGGTFDPGTVLIAFSLSQGGAGRLAKLQKARSRLYRSRILNPHLKALAEIYAISTFLQPSDLKCCT